MIKEVIVKYELDDCDTDEFLKDMNMHKNGRLALDELYNYLRQKWKYEDLSNTSSEDLIDTIYEKFHDILREFNIELF